MRIDLERLNVLVVDDSDFIRTLIANCLKIIGVGRVLVASEGGAAIETLLQVKNEPAKAGVMSIDMVISNWEMSPVNGLMLLRWVRRHKDAPDRFLPFIFLTAYSDPERVNEARLYGVNEILAKPFTIQALMDKIVNIIQRNRQFVHTKDYFGPDRRRQLYAFEGEERRLLTDKSPEVEIVHV
jgi:two-component system, chemotaxis family, chemotaxis protein CheY